LQHPLQELFQSSQVLGKKIKGEEMELTPLYEVKLIDQDDHHYYTIGEDPTLHPGVTGILDVLSKPQLLPWGAKCSAEYIANTLRKIRSAGGLQDRLTDRFLDLLVKRAKKQHRFIKEKAARVGSDAHALFDRFIKENIDIEEGAPYQASFEYFLETEELEIIQGDSRIGSKIYSYGGSLDAIALDKDGRFSLLDWKSGKSIWPSMAAQLAAYSFAMKETYGLDYYPKAMVVRFDKEERKYEKAKIRDVEHSFKVFEEALKLSNLLKIDPFIEKKTINSKRNVKK